MKPPTQQPPAVGDQFDFDEWARLAQEDPAGFEARRRALIEAELAESASRNPETARRMRGLQWQIDCERARSGSPLGACIRLSRMMWDSVYGEGGLRDALEGRAGPGSSGGHSAADPVSLADYRERRREERS